MSLKPAFVHKGNALQIVNQVSTAKMCIVMHSSFTCDENYTFLYIFQQSINKVKLKVLKRSAIFFGFHKEV